MMFARRCDICDTATMLFEWVEPRGTWMVCRRCLLQLRANDRQWAMKAERLTITEGCELRLLFYWWLRLAGRLTEYPSC